MNTLEDKVKTALLQTADEIRPHQVPPLRLTGRRLRNAWDARQHRMSPWLVPLTAAAAVAAVIAASVVISSAIHPARRPVAASIPAATLAKVPPFFIGLTGGVPDQQRRAVVAATATGKALATVLPPKPYGAFDWVSAAADGRTFVLAAQRWVPIAHWKPEPVVFFKLVLNAAGKPGRLTPLPVTPVRGFISGVALSPDGSKLAVATHGPGDANRDPGIRVYDTATGRSRHWVWPGTGWIGVDKPYGQALSWAAGSRTLAFQQHLGGNGGNFQVRLLDTLTQAGSLRSTKLVIGIPGGTIYGPIAGNTLLTPDGSKIVAASLVLRHNRVKAVDITEFATSTGKPLRVLNPVSARDGGSWEEVVWTDHHGGTLVLASTVPGTGSFNRPGPVVLGIYDGHKFLPLPAAAQKFNPEEVVW
jgi:hypothetical protein